MMTKKVIDEELKSLQNEFNKLDEGKKFIVHFIKGIDIECRLDWVFGLCCALVIDDILLTSKDKKAKIIYNYLYGDDWNNNKPLYNFCLSESKTLINKYEKEIVSFDEKCKEYYRKIYNHYDKSDYSVWWGKEFPVSYFGR